MAAIKRPSVAPCFAGMENSLFEFAIFVQFFRNQTLVALTLAPELVN